MKANNINNTTDDNRTGLPIQLDDDSSSSAWLETVSEQDAPKTTELKSKTKEKTKTKKKIVGFGNLDNVEEMMKDIEPPIRKMVQKNNSFNEDYSVFNVTFSKKFEQKMDLIDGNKAILIRKKIQSKVSNDINIKYIEQLG